MMKNKIKIGYEIGTNKECFVVPSHLIVTGITQLSGKTTTLEALIKRSGLKAIVFKTKIGEKGFSTGTEIPPFFRDRSDYEFVKSLIEAYAKEKLFLEKGTLMRLCKGSKNLIEIKKQVDDVLAEGKLRGLKEEIHTRLQHYLENLIPQIQYANLSNTLSVYEGINLMNLERFSEEAQSLIIQSVADEVLKTMKDVILVIPEAWKFLPQKYNNPCKRVVESFIRQGATNNNFIWIDSQDMAGVDKIPLKQISTWCVPPETLIKTKRGWTQISEIKKGEKVLTHKGRFKKVIEIKKRKYKGNIKSIKTYGNYKELRITEEHLILCEKITKHGIKGISNSTATLSNGEKKRYRYEKPIKPNPIWVEASKISKENLLMFSRPKHKKTNTIQISSEFIKEINEDIIRIAGWYLAEGFKDGLYNTDFALGHTEQNYALEILNSAKKLGVNGDMNHKKNGIRVRLFSKGLQKFLLEHFGKGAKNKKIPEWVYNLNNNLIELFLDCYIKGDGHQLKQNKGRFKSSTISEELAFGIRDLCLILGYPCSISRQETEHNPKFIIQHDISKDRYGNRQAQGRIGIDNNFFYVRVRSVKDENYNGFVYNLEVEEDNSYETICGIIHNCLGYQSERNEVKHTLDQIALPKKSKPKEDEIMNLKKGHFFVSSYEGVKKIYVQPIWMDDSVAISIAKGKINVDTVEQSESITPYSKAGPTQEKEIRSFDDSKIRKDLIELRGDFFNKIQEQQEAIQKAFSEIYSIKSAKREVNEEELISKLLQKIPITANNKADPINKEEIIQEVLKRVPAQAGSVTYEVAPLEKIKKDFLEEAKNKILEDIKNLSDAEKKALKYMESRSVEISNSELVLNCFKMKQGGSSSTKISGIVTALKNVEAIEKTAGGRNKAILKKRISFYLSPHEGTEQEIQQVYDHILAELL